MYSPILCFAILPSTLSTISVLYSTEFRVICVIVSPIDCAATLPTESPGWTLYFARCYSTYLMSYLNIFGETFAFASLLEFRFSMRNRC